MTRHVHVLTTPGGAVLVAPSGGTLVSRITSHPIGKLVVVVEAALGIGAITGRRARPEADGVRAQPRNEGRVAAPAVDGRKARTRNMTG